MVKRDGEIWLICLLLPKYTLQRCSVNVVDVGVSQPLRACYMFCYYQVLQLYFTAFCQLALWLWTKMSVKQQYYCFMTVSARSDHVVRQSQALRCYANIFIVLETFRFLVSILSVDREWPSSDI